MEGRRTRDLRRARARRVAELAAHQGGVVSRAQIYALGLTRAEVRADVRAGRWARVGSRSIVVHTGDVSTEGRWWAAVFEGGDRACLDGETALLASGLQHYASSVIRVSVPRGVLAHHFGWADIRQTRRWRADDVVASGVPRVKVEIAAVRAALWARSDKQAALLLSMTVQQGLSTPERIGRALLDVRRDRRRSLAHAVVLDLLGGARSLGELDFARQCRRRGLPEPTRQAVRRGRDGRYYLDALWEDYAVVVEIDGIQHGRADQVVADALRHNEVTLDHLTVMRLPLLGLRVAPGEFFDQIARALTAGGWNSPPTSVAS
ncbi:MAG: hypothetical protein H0X12_16255 [Nocardioides sp.]|nr:hypothetical protein [Nocardioides sp.]